MPTYIKALALFLGVVFSVFLSTPALATGGCTAVDFKVPRSFDIGVNGGFTRVALVAADLNGDGKPDVVTSDFAGNAVAVFLNDGTAWFPAPTRFTVGTHPLALALADFNADGKSDLVVANQGTNNVSVLLGLGGGAFGPATNFGVGNGPASLTVGDFNGDSKIDVAVGNVQGHSVSLLLGDGAGAFSSASGSPFAFGGDVLAVNNADFNSDTKRDLVVSVNSVDSATTGFFVLLGNGAGGFSAPSQVFSAAGLGTSTADLNNDSKADLILGHFGGMVVLIGDGVGGFSSPTLHNLEVGLSVDAIDVGDLDGDNNVDVVAASVQAGLTVFKGDGTGAFIRGRAYVAKESPFSVTLSDYDDDGKRDIAVAGPGGPGGPSISFSIIQNTGGAFFAAPRAVATDPPNASGLTATDVAVDDFNGDGRPDMAVTQRAQSVAFGSVAILLNDASGGFTRMTPIIYFPILTLNRVVTADFNEDGKADVAVAGALSSMSVVSISLGNGDGTFAAPQNVSVGVENPYDLAVAEFNNDGNLDIVVLGTSSQNYSILLGNGSGGFSVGSSQSVGTHVDRVAVGDFNGDSFQDIVITDFDDSRLVVLQNNGSGSFAVSQSVDLPGPPSAVVVDDYNADGKRDIAVASQNQSFDILLDEGRVSVLLGHGTGGFAAPVGYEISSRPDDLISRDLDGDGKPDLALVDRLSSTVSVLSGDGLGGFGPSVKFDVLGGPWALAAADFDFDSRIDLAVLPPFALSVDILSGKTPTTEPCLFADDATITEGNAGTSDVAVTVRLSSPSAQVVRLNYGLRGFSATEGQDFSGAAATLTFQPGETSKIVNVPVLGDIVDEPDETFGLFLASPLNARIGDGIAKVTITDNEAQPQITISDASVVEGHSVLNPNTANFTVSLSAPSAFQVTVEFAVISGTAILGNDFEPACCSLTFAPGTTTAAIVVSMRGDVTHEGDETFFVNLSNPTSSTIADSQAQGTILNDDPPPGITAFNTASGEALDADNNLAVTIRLSNPSSLTVSADFATADGTATAGSDYVAATGTVTFNPGETEKILNFTIKHDLIDEIHETFFVNLSNLVVAVAVDLQADCLIFDNDGPEISINDVSVLEGQSGTKNASFTLSLSAASPQDVGVRITTANGTASSSSDYQSANRSIFIPAGSTTATLNIVVIGDPTVEPDETFFVNLSLPAEGTIGDAQGVATITNDDATLQFNATQLSVVENDNRANLTVTRLGATLPDVAVNYATSDAAGLTNCNVVNGIASSRCDYATSVGTVRFAVGETSKTISIPIVDDAYAEGNENFTVSLSNASGAIVGAQATATITITDNDAANGPNPIDQTPFFVRQQYVDFLGREPDPGGFAAWQSVISNCPAGSTDCDRIHVSSGFFRSPEFQGRGYFIYRFYPVAFGRKPEYVEFIPDLAKVSGFLSDTELEAARVAFIAEFMSRPAFVTKFDGLSNTQYVDTLLATAGITHTARNFWITSLGNGTRTRAEVLREIAESTEVYNKYYNQAFVVMQYFGYLRRDPDALYLDWIQVLETTGDFRGMVNGFMNSSEYRFRFGP